MGSFPRNNSRLPRAGDRNGSASLGNTASWREPTVVFEYCSIVTSDGQRGSLDALYREFFERGVHYGLPDTHLRRTGNCKTVAQAVVVRRQNGGFDLSWLGSTYELHRDRLPLSDNEMKLLRTIGDVLSARYRVLLNPVAAAERLDLFRGMPEDRYVSAFLEPGPYADGWVAGADRVAEAIDALRISSSATYENRRIATGVLLFGNRPDPCHPPPPSPDGALPYSPALTMFRTFHQLSDGLRTVALVDAAGRMVELVDIEQWATPFADMPLPAPCSNRFAAHCRATLHGGHICLVLTPNGEIKAFADGIQMFNFLDGRWRLSDVGVKYASWKKSLANDALAERLFTTALNLAERRRGGLLVVLTDAKESQHLLASVDRLDRAPPLRAGPRSKAQFQYLLRGRSVVEVTPAVLESIARIDGAIVVDSDAHLLAFGAILRHPSELASDLSTAEGGRTTAAIAASRHGHVLKISEDGTLGFYAAGRCVWEL